MTYKISWMRYPSDHKDRVRQRILGAAARRFRGGGSESAAISDLMRDLGLTHGGFYRHFQGKEQLFQEALLLSFAQARARLEAAAERAPAGRELEAVIESYLSEEHCAHPEDGCPFAALATEISRQPRKIRAMLDRAVRENVAAIAWLVPGKTSSERERAALVLFSGMAGALNLARATADPALRRSILAGARKFYLRALSRR